MPNTHAMRFTALPKGLQDVTLVPDPGDSGPPLGLPTEDRPPVLIDDGGSELDPILIGDPVVQPVVSAHVAFRLTPDAADRTLGDFPTALDWPNQPIDWTLTFRRGDRIESFPALVVSDDPVAEWWSTIFQPGLPVRGYTPPTNRSQRRIRSFRQTRLANRSQRRLRGRRPVDRTRRRPLARRRRPDHRAVRRLRVGRALGREPRQGLRRRTARRRAGVDARQRRVRPRRSTTRHGPSASGPPRHPGVPALPVRVRNPDPPDTGAEVGDRVDRISWVARRRSISTSSPPPAPPTQRCCDRCGSSSTSSRTSAGSSWSAVSAASPTPSRSSADPDRSPPTRHRGPAAPPTPNGSCSRRASTAT